LTSRGFKEQEFEKVAEFLHRAVQVGVRIQAKAGKLLKDFIRECQSDEEVKTLRAEIEAFATKFEMPGL
jgi:glycine hydroxymethyltransferase